MKDETTKIDMSSEVISICLRQVDQIRYLCLSLMKAKKSLSKKKKKKRQDDRNEQKQLFV
jgi:hypothetical protein